MRLGLVLLLAVTVFAHAEWAIVACHGGHTRYSDGERTPWLLKRDISSAGFQVLIPTDHYEQIPSEKKGVIPDKIGMVGFENYFNDYSSDFEIFGIKKTLLVLPCVEITNDNPHYHTLAFGEKIQEFCGTPTSGTVEGQVEILKKYGLITVLAHPHWKLDNLPFEKLQNYNGIEFFNNYDPADFFKDLSLYLELVNSGKLVFPTGGIDIHYTEDPMEILRMQRQTIVQIDEIKTQNVLSAFRKGNVLATNHGLIVKNCDPAPSFAALKSNLPRISLDIGFKTAQLVDRKLKVFRDKTLVYEIALGIGKSNLRVDFIDTQALPGLHRYIVVIDQCLVTAPWIFEVAENDYPKGIIIKNAILTSYDNSWVGEGRFIAKVERDIDQQSILIYRAGDYITASVIYERPIEYLDNIKTGIDGFVVELVDSRGVRYLKGGAGNGRSLRWQLGQQDYRFRVFDKGKFTVKLTDFERKKVYCEFQIEVR